MRPAATLQRLHHTADTLGVALPETFAAEVARAEHIRADTEKLGVDVNLIGTIVDAIDHGRDPLDDENVRRATTGKALVATNIGEHGRQYVDDLLSQAINDHADDVLEAITTPANKAAETLLSVADSLPASLDATADVVRQGSSAADKWGQAQHAINQIRAAVEAWNAVASHVHAPGLDQHHQPLRYADISLTACEAVQAAANRDRVDVDAWRITRAGHTVSLPIISEWRARVTRYDAEVQARRDRDDKLAREKGFSVPANAYSI